MFQFDRVLRLLIFASATVLSATCLAASESLRENHDKVDLENNNYKEYEQMQLFAQCTPVSLIVGIDLEEAKSIGVTEKSIVNAVESRLRSARLFSSDEISQQSLVVSLSLVNQAFHVSIELVRFVLDTGFGMPGTVVVWETERLGTHAGDSGFILGAISQSVDEFLTKYLRANENNCL